MISLDSLWLLLLFVVVAAAAFYAGWRASAAYLSAAQAVSSITAAAVAQSNNFGVTLDKYTSEAASLRQSVEQLGERVGRDFGDVEALIQTLIVGFERAGIVRRAETGTRGGAPGRQHGEAGET